MTVETPLPPVTVNILTGFLGSGKTSLLKRLLILPDLKDAAVLINEFDIWQAISHMEDS